MDATAISVLETAVRKHQTRESEYGPMGREFCALARLELEVGGDDGGSLVDVAAKAGIGQHEAAGIMDGWDVASDRTIHGYLSHAYEGFEVLPEEDPLFMRGSTEHDRYLSGRELGARLWRETLALMEGSEVIA